jgi:hypothetical protein
MRSIYLGYLETHKWISPFPGGYLPQTTHKCSECGVLICSLAELEPCPKKEQDIKPPDEFYPHEWKDVSYHGSPSRRCEFCDAIKISDTPEHCTQAKATLAARAAKKEQDERAELAAMQDRIDSYFELLTKYGRVK